MSTNPSFVIHQLSSKDMGLMSALLDMFGVAFDDTETYGKARPGKAYFERLISGDQFIALAAVKDGAVIGGLAAYELHKFEQERSEIYVYDLAVSESKRRKGVATALLNALNVIAGERNAYVIFIQADLADDPAIALYTKLGVREDVLHFDIPVADARR